MTPLVPQEVDTVIVGNGPSALILSYILHGHVPVYDQSNPHPDPLLHEKLKNTPDLLNLDVDHITEHFAASRISYSTQALPVNVLLDTLIRPLGETEDVDKRSCVKWIFDSSRAVPHLVVGNAPEAGGQWADNPVKASWDIGTLSYTGMLSLPGYGFDEHYTKRHGRPLPFYQRPSRRAVADYLAVYPHEVRISQSLYNAQKVSGISRMGPGFLIASHQIQCRHLVLASGIFTELIPPRPLLQPLHALPSSLEEQSPKTILVVGSGFSAADVIISSPPNHKIVHIFKWAPATSPSPLRACHQQAYPEYASVYRKMKLAALCSKQSKDKRPKVRRKSSSTFDLGRDWKSDYEGLPNVAITKVELDGQQGVFTLENDAHEVFERRIDKFVYVVGRRGKLDYLQKELRRDVCPSTMHSDMISGQSMRDQANEDLEVSKNVFIVGSLTGDSLIRFAYGGCTFAAGKILQRTGSRMMHHNHEKLAAGQSPAPSSLCPTTPRIPAMNGLDGHCPSPSGTMSTDGTPIERGEDGEDI